MLSDVRKLEHGGISSGLLPHVAYQLFRQDLSSGEGWEGVFDRPRDVNVAQIQNSFLISMGVIKLKTLCFPGIPLQGEGLYVVLYSEVRGIVP
jgi:hypothetical protein